jgi:hypothetical protein
MDRESRRLSGLALASALCLPGAVLAGALGALLARMAGQGNAAGEGAAAIGKLSAAGMLLGGMILGLAALRSIRANPELTGRGLAWTGVLAFPAAVLLALVLYTGASPRKRSVGVRSFRIPPHEGRFRDGRASAGWGSPEPHSASEAHLVATPERTPKRIVATMPNEKPAEWSIGEGGGRACPRTRRITGDRMIPTVASSRMPYTRLFFPIRGARLSSVLPTKTREASP